MMKLVQPSCPKINYVKKMRSKNKRKVTSSLDKISTSRVTGNNHVANGIDFNMVKSVEEQKGML